MTKSKLVALVATCSLSLFSQKNDQKETLRISGGFQTTTQHYVKDEKRDIVEDSLPTRSNSYLNLNLDYGKWSAGIQGESYYQKSLLNFNPVYDEQFGLATYFARFKSNKLDVTAGYFYEQFGSGLLFRSWEDRSLGINNALMGGKVIFTPTDAIALKAIYGKHRSGFKLSNGSIFGADLEIDLSQLLKAESTTYNVGFSYVGRYEPYTRESLRLTGVDQNSPVFDQLYFLTDQERNFNELVNGFAGRFSFSKNSIYISGEYNHKSPDAQLHNLIELSNQVIKPGNALILNMGYSKKGLGIDLTLRRVENMGFFSEKVPEQLDNGIYPVEVTQSQNNQTVLTNQFLDKTVNFIPGLTKQHHSFFGNIYVYQALGAFSGILLGDGLSNSQLGEIGGQLDIFYKIKKGSALGGRYGTKIAINLSNYNRLDADFFFSDTPEKNFSSAPDYKTNSFLGAREKYFSDYNIEISKKFNKKVNSSLVYINQYYNHHLIAGPSDIIVKSNILFSESTFKLGKRALTLGVEHMWADADRKDWAGGMIEYSHNSNFSFYVSDYYNYGFDKNESLIAKADEFQIHFWNAGATFSKGSTRINLSYGRQRGGLVCSGGVCRVVPPSTGFNLELSTIF